MSVTILIVDDEPALNELFVIGLKKYGFVTEGVLGGRECLDLLATPYTPDLILLDMMMEPMDGWETLTNIKADPMMRKIPVIMQTGKNITFKEAEQFTYYIEDYVMKPITPKRCVDYINEILESRKQVTEILTNTEGKGYSEEQIDKLINLNRAIAVSDRLMKLLVDRYGYSSGSNDPESYGASDFDAFRSKLITQYKNLQKEMGVTLPF